MNLRYNEQKNKKSGYLLLIASFIFCLYHCHYYLHFFIKTLNQRFIIGTDKDIRHDTTPIFFYVFVLYQPE